MKLFGWCVFLAALCVGPGALAQAVGTEVPNFKGLTIGMPLDAAMALPNPDIEQWRTREAECRSIRASYCSDLRDQLRRKTDNRLLAWQTTPGGQRVVVFSPRQVFVGDYIVEPKLTFDCEVQGCPLVELRFRAATNYPASASLRELIERRYGPLANGVRTDGDTLISYSVLSMRSLGVGGPPFELVSMESLSYRQRAAQREQAAREREIERQQNF